jgi:uncharacterized repeat protein (TIGR04138 family)
MQKADFNEALDQILRADKRYDRDAYLFVREGLDFTLRRLKKATRGQPRHVRGQELLHGLREYALEQFGPLAKTVLEHWGVRRCEDFGEIVFNMVDKAILGKSDEDSREDFKGGYDFDEAFVAPFQPARVARNRLGAAETAPKPGRRAGRSSDTEKMSSGSN